MTLPKGPRPGEGCGGVEGHGPPPGPFWAPGRGNAEGHGTGPDGSRRRSGDGQVMLDYPGVTWDLGGIVQGNAGRGVLDTLASVPISHLVGEAIPIEVSN